MSDINVISRTQKVIVDAASSSVSIINAGPQGPGFGSEVKSYTVLGGTLGTQPTFSGTPLFTGKYVQLGRVIYFSVDVKFTNITSFGTGQYYVSIPFKSEVDFMVKSGVVNDVSTGKHYSLSGKVIAESKTVILSYTASNGHEDPFTYNSPVTLVTADSFNISGVYLRPAQGTASQYNANISYDELGYTYDTID